MLTRQRLLAGCLVVAAGAFAPVAAMAAKTQVFDGTVTHVSVNNVKVRNVSGQELGFLIVPRFNQIFKANGTTSVQMKDIKAGNFVRVYFDQSALGARHADRILVDTHPFRPLKS